MSHQTKARPCKRRLPNGQSCGHSTRNPSGDCGRHGTGGITRESASADAARSRAAAAALSESERQESVDTFHLAGTLAQKGKSPNEHQKALQSALEESMNGEAWQHTLKVAGQMAKHPQLRGWRNRVFVVNHIRRIGGEGLVLPRSKWEELGRSIKDGCKGQPIWVPMPWSREEPADDASAEDASADSSGASEPRIVGGTNFLFGGRSGKARYYDISETEGPELSDEQWARVAKTVQGTSEERTQQFLDDMHSVAEKAGCEIVELEPDKMPSATHMGHIEPTFDRIAIRADMSPAAKASVIAHELAHMHDPALARCKTTEERMDYYCRSRDECEFIAESVAYAVASHYGVDTSESSATYIHGYRPKQAKRAKKLYERAMKAMDAVLGSEPVEKAAA